MERNIMNDLVAWKNRDDRKPLILLGARQVGKTYIQKEFGKCNYIWFCLLEKYYFILEKCNLKFAD